MIRRAFKIWPACIVFLGYLTIGCLIKYHAQGIGFSVDQLWPNYLHLQNYFGSIRAHTWSLSVEEHFYLALPLVLLLFLRWGRPRPAGLHAMPWFTLALIIVCTGLRYWNATRHPFTYVTHQYPTHLRIDGLFFGVYLGYLYHFHPVFMTWLARYRWYVLIAGFVLLSPWAVWELEKSVMMQSFGFAYLYLGYGAILLFAVSRPTPKAPGRISGIAGAIASLLAFIGYYSYSIYLWHVDGGAKPVHVLLEHGVGAGWSPPVLWGITMSLFIVLGSLTGILLSRLVEMPVLVLREKLYPSPDRPIEAK
ncbi:MAG: acyltransferase [Kiritimatiellae bacterium]|nr:acyltransferase [Kiritimatiellia bacterium]